MTNAKKIWNLGIVAAFGLVLLLAQAGMAQVATPPADATPSPVELAAWGVTEPIIPMPEQCTIEPASTDDVAAEILALDTRALPEVTGHGVVAISGTGPAPQEAVDGVLATLTQFWACNNAGNRASLVALMTAQGIADLYALDLTADEETVRAAVAAALTQGEPRAAEEMAGIDGVTSIVSLDDGRIAALVLNTDPQIAGGAPVQDLFICEAETGQYLIDAFIGDPFNAIDGYGFDVE
jgi:hypothetical protein